MSKLIASDALWKEGGGYYTENPEDLRCRPLLPDTGRLRDQRILALFRDHGNLTRDSRVLEIGCGKSMWLPCIVREFGCQVGGIDIEPYAAELARANLAGAGVSGEILCRDAFDVSQNRDLFGKFDLIYSMGVMEHFEDAAERLAILANYLKPGGRIITTVPNLQGVNWVLQRYASLERLHMHVIYDKRRLAAIHERAKLRVLAADYVGFYDGFVSAPDLKTAPARRKMHERLCWASNMLGAAWIRAGGSRLAPEIKWFSPHVFCAASRSPD